MKKKMEKINKNRILTLVLVFAIMCVGLVSAVNLVTPATSDVISGATASFNVTNETLIEVLNCTFYASSTLTANSSAVSLGTLTNDTAGDVNINGTLDTTVLEDANNYQIYASCWNATDQSNSSSNTGITIDNTVPTAATSLSPSDNSKVLNGSLDFTGTVVGSATTSCTLEFVGIVPPGGNSQSMTHTGNTCSLSLTNVPDQTYNWFIRASDETNTTDSSELTVNADVTTSAGKVAVLIEESGITSEGGALLSIAGEGEGKVPKIVWIIGVIAIVGIVLYKRRK